MFSNTINSEMINHETEYKVEKIIIGTPLHSLFILKFSSFESLILLQLQNIGGGTVIGTIKATDADTGRNGQINYYVTTRTKHFSKMVT